MKFSFLFLSLIVCSSAVWASETRVDHDGMLLVDGERCFILGLYQNATDDDFAKEAAEAGFNLIRSNANQEELDRAEKNGMKCWIPVGGWDVESDQQKENLKNTINAYKSHPALAIWEGPDEILWNAWWHRWNRALKRRDDVNQALQKYEGPEETQKQLKQWKLEWDRFRSSGRYAQADAIEDKMRKAMKLNIPDEKLSEWYTHIPSLMERLREGTSIVRDCDPNHAVWFNHAPRNTMSQLNGFEDVADIIGCDIYPVPFGRTGHSDLHEKTIAAVGAYTRRMADAAPGKAVWMVLQGFGWDDLSESVPKEKQPRPTYDETRFMAYDAIVNGAQGILYWGTFAPEPNSQLWKDIKKVVLELSRLQPFLSAKKPEHQITLKEHPRYGSSEKGIVWLDKETKDEVAIFVVNEGDESIAFDLLGLSSFNGKEVHILNEPETLTIQNNHLTFGLASKNATVLLIQK